MAVPSVFISSVVRGFENIREAAALAVRGVGMHPVLSEGVPADSASPRRALLDEVAKADYYLLLLGSRYGNVSAGGKSPTEDEYDEATARGLSVLVLVQDVELEPRQQEFLDRIRGNWADGVLYDRFQDATDVGAKVAAALGRLQAGVVEDAPASQAKALELVRGEEVRGAYSSGIAARVAFVPLRQTTLLDAVTLEAPGLGDSLAEDLRSAGVVPQRIGIAPQVSGQGVVLEGTDADNWTQHRAEIGRDGSILVTGSVAVEEGAMGFSLVDPERLAEFIREAGRFAQAVWDRIDQQAEVARVATVVAIPEAQHKGFGRASGDSMSISMQVPPTVVAPEPALVVARGQLAEDGVVAQLVAEVKRVFADAGAVQE